MPVVVTGRHQFGDSIRMATLFKRRRAIEPHQVIRTFLTVLAAREYRHTHGTGGWIFVPADKSQYVVLFPPGMSRSSIMAHPMCVGIGQFIRGY